MQSWNELAATSDPALARWTSNQLKRCDPYLIWSDASTVINDQKDIQLTVLVELKPGQQLGELHDRINADGTKILATGFEPQEKAYRFHALNTSREGIDSLTAEVVKGDLERFTLQQSRPRIARETLRTFTFLDEGAGKLQSKSAVAEQVYLGIIDDGLPFLRLRPNVEDHPPVHLWDQGWLRDDRVSPPEGLALLRGPSAYWQPPWTAVVGSGPIWFRLRGYLFGRRLRTLPPAGRSQPDEYMAADYFHPSPGKTHGASVLALMAPWISNAQGPVAWPSYVGGLAMVQLPTRTVEDTSGGSLGARALDGIRFVLWQEESDRGGSTAPRPTVVNLSYGTHAGPHDGTSMFERAAWETLEANAHLHLVLPAGNAQQTGCHAARTLGPAGTSSAHQQLTVRILPDNGRDTYLEIWVPFDAQLRVSIRPPGSVATFAIAPGEAKLLYESGTTAADVAVPHLMAVYPPEVAQSTQRTMVLIAIAPTRHMTPSLDVGARSEFLPRRFTLGWAGDWTIELANLEPMNVPIDAWIERDDTAPDRPAGGRQAYFPDSCVANVASGNSSSEDTLNGIATFSHNRLHVVGAMRRDGLLSDYSGSGSTSTSAGAVPGPEYVAAADHGKSRPGIRSLGFLEGASSRISGTSAACAVFTRALARQLATGTSLPTAISPARPREVSCSPERFPEGDRVARGWQQRRDFPSTVDLSIAPDATGSP